MNVRRFLTRLLQTTWKNLGPSSSLKQEVCPSRSNQPAFAHIFTVNNLHCHITLALFCPAYHLPLLGAWFLHTITPSLSQSNSCTGLLTPRLRLPVCSSMTQYLHHNHHHATTSTHIHAKLCSTGGTVRVISQQFETAWTIWM